MTCFEIVNSEEPKLIYKKFEYDIGMLAKEANKLQTESGCQLNE